MTTKCHRSPRLRGIGKAAKDLKISRQHLWAVLHGHRPDPHGLLARYHELLTPTQPPPS